jgi:hypothetical protein
MEQTNLITLSDRYVIDMTKLWHVAWWAKQFGVSEELLQAAVGLVGRRADLVGLYLDQQMKSTVH